ncbi:MAG: Hydroxymethylpyrimidine phosphate kinase ThiD (EC [uncultured Sulfurovum sp.]|uniref:hydroxymethylpyrimidine kinase n=1 Tax=uncultured Sulfurovum sp. TaxID=269237 RepID=A0A6S6UCC1_9BACT|nr:MAG: Hydroxymethylpyrimidine phosphate kinase ThiD (EC [uncultured Sulfurovum sp.]
MGLCLQTRKVGDLMSRYNSVLSIAGSDSSGGAGIQADIKSISANGAYAATVITATTAQNTQGVTDIHGLPIAHIKAQLEAVLSDIEFGAVKIGMLHSSEVIDVVASTLKAYGIKKIVLDPVMVATSGDKLITNQAIDRLKEFLPHTYLITPNIPEAELLIGHKIDLSNMETSVKELAEKFSVSVLLKGGHLEAQEFMTDMLYIKETAKLVIINNDTVKTNNTHGTGCSLSSSIATYLTLGFELEEAVVKSCTYLNEAIKSGKDKVLGKGNGPIDHFYAL